MQNQEISKEELVEEIAVLKKRIADLQDWEPKYKKIEEKLREAQNELEIQIWGLGKTNEAIKVLYKELEEKNKKLQELDRLKSDFINTVSHELRTPLTTIREGISQVLDGLHGEITEEQRDFLSISLEDVDRLKRIIDNLLDISKLEAGKFKIIREEVDIIGLARKAIAVFVPQAKSKNLEIREKFLNEKAIACIDSDSIIQVFSNLIGNALKFTSQGYVEVSISDKDEYIECSIVDTGRGISEEDLLKVFDKFQQFGRVEGPGEKGTGLGLSICKSIIELHRGKIWVDSLLNRGTKFIFTLPKYSAGQLYREYFTEALNKAIQEKSNLSILIFGIKDFQAVCKSIESEKINSITRNLENLVGQNLRQADIVIKNIQTIFVIFPETEKQKALVVAQRIERNIQDYLLRERLEGKIEIFSKVVGYPDDGSTEEQIYAKIA
jgi:signal transduction histidine kinase